MKILVAGAAGFVGSHLIPALDEQGHEVVALDIEEYEGPAESVVGDLTEYESFADALEDVDMAYYLVHSMGQSGDLHELEETCAQNFRRALDEHDVDRVIYLTGIIHHRDGLSEHLDSRTHVGEILAQSSADLTQLRAAIILGRGSGSFRIMEQLVDRLPVMVAPRSYNADCQPIYIEDIIAYLTALIDDPETRGETFEVGGPDVLSYGRMLEVLGEVRGKDVRFYSLPVPVPFRAPASFILDIFTDLPDELIEALIGSAALGEDMTVQEDPISAVIDHECVGYREACERLSRG